MRRLYADKALLFTNSQVHLTDLRTKYRRILTNETLKRLDRRSVYRVENPLGLCLHKKFVIANLGEETYLPTRYLKLHRYMRSSPKDLIDIHFIQSVFEKKLGFSMYVLVADIVMNSGKYNKKPIVFVYICPSLNSLGSEMRHGYFNYFSPGYSLISDRSSFSRTRWNRSDDLYVLASIRKYI